jgi:hypothetical protein
MSEKAAEFKATGSEIKRVTGITEASDFEAEETAESADRQ